MCTKITFFCVFGIGTTMGAFTFFLPLYSINSLYTICFHQSLNYFPFLSGNNYVFQNYFYHRFFNVNAKKYANIKHETLQSHL